MAGYTIFHPSNQHAELSLSGLEGMGGGMAVFSLT